MRALIEKGMQLVQAKSSALPRSGSVAAHTHLLIQVLVGMVLQHLNLVKAFSILNQLGVRVHSRAAGYLP